MTLHYRHELKHKARGLRTNMTNAEQLLWFHLRRKQIRGIQFYRQRPIGKYIVDFYAPAIRLVIEVDGGQHLETVSLKADLRRTAFLAAQGLVLVRYDNLQVIKETSLVLEEIYRIVYERESPSIPL